MHMRIVLRNLARQRIGRVEVIESQRPTRVHIEPAAREVMLDWARLQMRAASQANTMHTFTQRWGMQRCAAIG